MKFKTIVIAILIILALLFVIGMVNNPDEQLLDNQTLSSDSDTTETTPENDGAPDTTFSLEQESPSVSESDLNDLDSELQELETEDLTGFSG